MSAVNKVRFQQFLRQARGADIHEVFVNRLQKRNAVLLRYNGKGTGKKNRQRLTGEWSISSADKEADAITAEIKEFLELARKHFFVRRGEGLEDEVFADEEMEAKGKPIVSEESAGS